ncbi:MAG: glycosyltransferase [bacterium]|nr:glycosyltransferase [bacterium]
MPKVSVVIPSYNAAGYLPEAIDSVLAQTFKDYEVIVVDDGSTDNTREALATYQDKIRYICQENAGPSPAKNKGIREAKGKFVAFLDADDIWLPEKLAFQMEIFEKNPEIALVHANVIRFGEDWTESDEAQWQERIAEPRRKFTGYIFKPLLMDNLICTSAAVIKRSCFDDRDIGFFDKDLVRSEDHDLWLRIARKHKIGYVDRLLVRHREHKASLSVNVDAFFEAKFLVFNRHAKYLAPDERDKIIKEKWRWLYFTHGYEYFEAGDLKGARKRFLTAIKEGPFNPKAVIYYLATFFGSPLVTIIKKIRNSGCQVQRFTVHG